LQTPELSTVGSAQERAAFISFRLDRRTVREVGQAIGVSKSQVTNSSRKSQTPENGAFEL